MAVNVDESGANILNRRIPYFRTFNFRGASPTRAIFSPSITTSALKLGAPVPSMTRPP